MTNISIIQITIEVDGQLCYAKIPEHMETFILNFLKGDDGKIAAIKLPDSWKKVSLKEAME
jgi:hypothetical protein